VRAIALTAGATVSSDNPEDSCVAMGVGTTADDSTSVPSLIQKVSVQGAPRVQVPAPEDYADDGSTAVPSLIQKVSVQGASRVQVPAPEDYADDGSVEVRIVLPKHSHHAMEPGSNSQPKVVAMVELLEESKNDEVAPKVVALAQNVTVSDDQVADSSGSMVPVPDAKGKEVPKGSQTGMSAIPNNNQKEQASTVDQTETHAHLALQSSVLAENEQKVQFPAGESTEQVVSFLQENRTKEIEAARVNRSSHHMHHNHQHRHGRHLFLTNGTTRHRIASAVRHLLEGYLESAKNHPFLSPLLSQRVKVPRPNQSEHGVSEHASMPENSKINQLSFEEDSNCTNVLYFGCVLLSSCLLMWMFCLSSWPAAGEHLDVAFGIGPAVLVGKQAPDFTMTMLDGSTRRLRDITQDGKPVVVKFYNQDDDCKSVLRTSKFSQDVKGLELMARDVKYAGHVNFVLVNLQGRGAAVEYHNGLKLSGAFQSTFADAAILHGGLNGAWCDLSQDYNTSYCPHTTVINSQGIVVRNYNHLRWWTEGSAVGEDFAALSQTVDALMKVPSSD